MRVRETSSFRLQTNSFTAVKNVRRKRVSATNGEEMQFEIVAVSSIVTVIFVVAISLVYRDHW